MSETLRILGFQPSKNDYSLFLKQTDNSIVLVAVYVDDIIVTGNNSTDITALKKFLDEKFRIKDLGELHYFLGMELLKVPNGLIMTQRKFAMELLKDFQCDQLTTSSCPLAPLPKGALTEDALVDAAIYKRLVGKLNYLTNTRPDIPFQYNI